MHSIHHQKVTSTQTIASYIQQSKVQVAYQRSQFQQIHKH